MREIDKKHLICRTQIHKIHEILCKAIEAVDDILYEETLPLEGCWNPSDNVYNIYTIDELEDLF